MMKIVIDTNPPTHTVFAITILDYMYFVSIVRFHQTTFFLFLNVQKNQ